MPLHKANLSNIATLAPVFRVLPGLYLLLSPDFTILGCTVLYSKVANFNIEDTIGRNIFDTFPKKPNSANQRAKEDLLISLNHVVKEKEPHIMPLLRFDVPVAAGKEGEFEERFWNTTNTPVLNEKGKLIYILHETRDITDEVKHERNSKRLDLLSSALNAVAWEYDVAQNRMFWGKGLEEVFGYTQQDMGVGGESWRTRVHPDDFEVINASIKEAMLAKKKTWSGEYRFLKSDDTYAYVMDQAHIIYDKQGKPSFTLGSIVDMTNRKRTEDNLLESKQRFRHLVEVLPQIAWTASPSGKILHFNQNWYSYTGMSKGQTEGWIKMAHPDDTSLVLTTRQDAFITGEAFELEYRLHSYLDDSYRWFLERAVPMHDAQHKVTLWIGTLTDIDEQKLAMEQLEEKDRQFQNILRLSPAHICLLQGPLHTCSYITPGYSKLYGNRKFMGLKASEIWPEPEYEGLLKLLDQVYEEGDTVQICEYKMNIDPDRNGNLREAYFDFKYQPLADKGQTEGILLTAVDVTDLVDAKKKAEDLARLQRPD
ncbi:PAS domain-containing protein [Pontibacter sp. CAU 1760]